MLIKALILALLSISPIFSNSEDRVIDSSLLLNAHFEDGEVSDGFAFFINEDGYIITSAQNVYNAENDTYAIEIILKAQEIRNEPVSCFLEAEAKAVDIDRNLALLKPKKSLDVFCKDYPEMTPYFREYVKKNYIDPFLNNNNDCCPLVGSKDLGIKYPYLKNYTFIAQKTGKVTELRDKIKEETRYITNMVVDSDIDGGLSGAPVVDFESNFVGIIEYSGELKLPTVLTKGVVVGWLCELCSNLVVDFKTLYKNEPIPLRDHPICKEYKLERLYSMR